MTEKLQMGVIRKDINAKGLIKAYCSIGMSVEE